MGSLDDANLSTAEKHITCTKKMSKTETFHGFYNFFIFIVIQLLVV